MNQIGLSILIPKGQGSINPLPTSTNTGVDHTQLGFWHELHKSHNQDLDNKSKIHLCDIGWLAPIPLFHVVGYQILFGV
jgi:hypothetical protein